MLTVAERKELAAIIDGNSTCSDFELAFANRGFTLSYYGNFVNRKSSVFFETLSASKKRKPSKSGEGSRLCKAIQSRLA